MNADSAKQKSTAPLIAGAGWAVFMIGCGFLNRFVHWFNRWQFEAGGMESLLWSALWLVLFIGCLIGFVWLLDGSDRYRKRNDPSI